MQSLDDLWSFVLNNIKQTYSEVFVTLWLDDFKLRVLNSTYAVLVNSSDFKCNFVKGRHLPMIKECLEKILGYEVEVVILSNEKGDPDLSMYVDEIRQELKLDEVSDADFEEFPEASDQEEKIMKQASEKFPSYHKQYTFDNFIVGNSNNFAYEACVSVCKNLATQYNPLFIYGPSGLGKTHLLYAINNEILKKNKNANIIYIKGEDFANLLIETLQKKTSVTFRERFRKRFRKTDILMIDDIQFIAGKPSVQEEVFHTFNALYEEGKQIVLASDRPPEEIKNLETRLKTRFEGGLLVDIQPPDYELRTAIIKHKAKSIGVELEQNVVEMLAENLRNNVRQLEGAVKKLAAHSFLNGGKTITVEFAASCISDMLSGKNSNNITVDKIFDKITKKYSVTQEELKSGKRNREIAKARHVCIYVMRKMTDLSLPAIGKILNKDHSSIKSAFDNIDSQIKESSLLEIEINELMKEIKEEE